MNLYRISAVLMILYAAGHSVGALVSTPHFDAQANGVVDSMKAVHFACSGAEPCTWYGFYLGFGWFDTVFFLFTAFVAWFVGGIAVQERLQVQPLTWALLASYVAGAVLSYRFFFFVPLAFSVAIVLVLGIAIWREGGARVTQRNLSS